MELLRSNRNSTAAVSYTHLDVYKRQVYMLGHITHNDHVVARLEALGARTVFTPEEVPDGAAVLIRAHGEPERTYAVLREKRCQILDATCPNVARIHQIVAKAEELSLIHI